MTGARRSGGATTRLRLRVTPGAGRSGVIGRYGDAWKVRVDAAAERGRANVAVVGLVADAVGITHRDVRLVAGATTRDKVVELTGVTSVEAEERLDAARRKALK